MSETVNEAVECAHRHGVLGSASLMMAGPAAVDAVRRARVMPSLRVGLHVVAVEGPSMLGHAALPSITDARGAFPEDQLGLSLRYLRPRGRAQLAEEIEAQFAAFAATGLRLDHANAHKHMHLHPVVGGLLIRAGLRHGLGAIRVPAEPPYVLRACGETPRLPDVALYRWTRLLRWRAKRAGLRANDHCFGIAWSGQMELNRLLRLIPELPQGVSEIYFHPATEQTDALRRVMPGYRPEAELAALLDPAVRDALIQAGTISTFQELSGGVP